MVLVSPTMPDAGLKIKDPVRDLKTSKEGGLGVSDGDATLRSMEFVFLANWTGCPAVSAPVGYVDAGEGGEGRSDAKGEKKGMLPVGIMGMGEWGSEEALMDWVEDGKGFLEDKGAGGVRKPAGWEGAWVDVLDRAKGKQ